MNITLADRFKHAGQFLKEGASNIVKSLMNPVTIDPLNPMSYRGDINNIPTGSAFGNSFWLFGNDGVDRYFDFANADCSLKAYRKCPPVAAILQAKAQAYMNGKTWILNAGGKAKDKESTKPEAVKIRKLFSNPNPIQSGAQFESLAYLMLTCTVMRLY
jgi:hypothetical protein